MRVPSLLLCLVSLLAGPTLPGQSPEEVPEPYRSLPQALRDRAAQFTAAPVAEGKVKPEFFKLDLGAKSFRMSEEDHFAAFKIHTPKTPGLDMVWCFHAPEVWQQWYIVPATGTMEGFRNWLNADRAYTEFPGAKTPPVALQTLDAGSLKPDADYFIWFHARGNKPPAGTLSAAILFAPPTKGKKGWDHEAVEKELGLHEAPAADQVTYLNSRGGKALLDKNLFDKSDGEERVKNVLFDIRNTQSMRGGYYVTIMTQLPVCKSKPSLNEIEKTHGPPDLILTGSDRAYFDSKLGKDEMQEVTAYYDHFGFIYRADDPAKKVYSVKTTAFSAVSATPTRDGLTFTDVTLAGLEMRLFYKDRKEVARIGHWGNRGAKVLSGDLPKGLYVRETPDHEREEMNYQGDGRWSYSRFSADGKLEREMSAEHHIWHGMLHDYYPNGKPRAQVTYKNGALDGELLQWDESGNPMPKRVFIEGREAPPEK